MPAQYFRNQLHIEDYLKHSSFLRDINNERLNDTQPISGAGEANAVSPLLDAEYDEGGDVAPRNSTYKKAITSLNNFVLVAFR